MIRKLFIALFVLFVTAGTFAQSYTLGEDSNTAKNKKLRYTVTLHYPQILKPSTPGQKGFNKHIEDKMDVAADSFKVWMKDWEIPDYFKKDLTMNSYYEIYYDTVYRTDKVISILFYEESYFLGAAHPNHYNYAVNYDLEKNKALKLNDMFTGNYLKAISDYAIKDLTKQFHENDTSRTEPDEWVVTGAGPSEDNYKILNFNANEIIITFPQYQVASYADGPQEVRIPLSELKDYIRKDGILYK